MDRIVIIEDDPGVQRALKRLFEPEGFAVATFSDGLSALMHLRASVATAVILDLGLPGMRGQDICQEVRRQFPSIPIIILSAAADVRDKVLLLELGADDYVTKPFSPRELLSRVRAAIRRSARPTATNIFEFSDISVDFSRMQVGRAGQIIPLTRQEFKMLKFFIRNPQRVISREELLSELWSYQDYPATRAVDNHLGKLRQKLEKDPAKPVHFQTVHGAGYRFVP